MIKSVLVGALLALSSMTYAAVDFKEVGVIEAGGELLDFSVTASGKYVIANYGSHLKILNTESNTTKRIDISGAILEARVFEALGLLAVVGEKQVSIYDLASDKLRSADVGEVQAYDFSDQAVLVVNTQGTRLLVDVQSGKRRAFAQGARNKPVENAILSRDSRYVVVTFAPPAKDPGGPVDVMEIEDLEKGKSIVIDKGDEFPTHYKDMHFLDGDKFAVENFGHMEIWSASKTQVTKKIETVNYITPSHDRRSVLVENLDAKSTVYSASGRLLGGPFEFDRFICSAFSGARISNCFENTVKVRDVKSGNLIAEIVNDREVERTAWDGRGEVLAISYVGLDYIRVLRAK